MKKKTIQEIKHLLFQPQSIDETLIAQLKQDERKGVQKLLQQYEQRQKKTAAERQAFLDKRTFDQQQAARTMGIAGIDEVGRGPLAGPVVAAAVVLDEETLYPGLTDSKALSLKRRLELDKQIRERSLVGVAEATPAEIDRYNIYKATQLAMKRAVEKLSVAPQYLLVDAMHVPVEVPQQKIVKGDLKSASIAAASIVAKVYRDRYMEELATSFPDYGFERNMGYGTSEHLEAIRKTGVCHAHRRSFQPVAEHL
ncbi:ribonuclease HII [Salsuginibacillus kocurii]|uniref:ribonuclease HII n=1 Tax=Salsuginibacillus kocurii TaxID=427078 RepID=UPI00037D44E3|nr:ribonuclease HII [Salsuginibacillus kocurii]